MRLGPEPGEDVPAYLARLPAELPAPGVEALALVQFAAELPGSAAVPAVAGAVPVTAVLRVPLSRVQTALRFEPLEQGVPLPAALDAARQRAQQEAAADTRRQAGRPRAWRRRRPGVLADPAAPCVLAMVVRAERASLDALAARPDVRACTRPRPGSPRASWRSPRCCPDRPSAPTRCPTTGPSREGRYPDRRVGVYPRMDSVEILMSVSVRAGTVCP